MARRRRFKKAVHAVSMRSRIVNTIAALIAASPAIGVAAQKLPSGDIKGTGESLAELYSAGASKGTFNWQLAIQAYGPILGAVLFKKAMSKIRGKWIV